jgi:hypothetical protein
MSDYPFELTISLNVLEHLGINLYHSARSSVSAICIAILP